MLSLDSSRRLWVLYWAMTIIPPGPGWVWLRLLSPNLNLYIAAPSSLTISEGYELSLKQ